MSASDAEQLLAQDAANRQRALELASFVVEAPAGAGKTELLVQRVLKLLTIVDEPEAIVALTFTKKAAAEMRERLELNLGLALRGECPAEPHRQQTYALARQVMQRSQERAWNLHKEHGRLRLMTLDALCASLARQMPLLSRFGAQPAVADDPTVHYFEAARRALSLVDGSIDEGMGAVVAEVLDYFDNRMGRLTELLATMLGRREQWHKLGELDHPERVINEALEAFLLAELAPAESNFAVGWQKSLMPLARFAAEQLGEGDHRFRLLADWTEPLAARLGDIPRWQALSRLLLTEKGSVRLKIDKRLGFPADKEFKEQKTAMLALLAELSPVQVLTMQRVAELPTDGLHNGAIVRALGRLLKLAAAQLWLVFREHGEVDFIELATRAIDALGEELNPSELGLRLDYQIQHLLVDEFQDTSPTQIDLLKQLTRGWQADDGRTLFVVGDPMQSIYRFRKADVGLFLNVANEGIGEVRLEPLRLSRNNRSVPAVVDWINQHFPHVFPEQDDPRRGEIRYRPFTATREPAPESGVTCHAVVVGPDLAAIDREGREADCVVRLIEQEWLADPARQIVVLGRARSHLAAIAARLRQRKIAADSAIDWSFSAVELEPLLSTQIVQDLLALTRSMHHRGDRLNWVAILRAPWCGLTLADLLALAGNQPERTIWQLLNDADHVAQLTADGQHRLKFLRAILAEAFLSQGRYPAREWVEQTWRALGGPGCLGDGAEARNAEAFFNRLSVVTDRHGSLDLDRLDEDMAALYAPPETPGTAPPRLQLMTIHKAKGLEFDTVIVPGLHRDSSSDDAPLLAWENLVLPGETSEQLIVAPCPRQQQDAADGPSLYDFLRRMERTRALNESLRVLYVAATRAKRRLHWLGVVEAVTPDAESPGAESPLKPPATNTLMAALWPAFLADMRRDQAMATPPESAEAVVPLAQFVPRLARCRRVPCRDSTSSVVPAAQTVPSLETLWFDQEDPLRFSAAIGTLVHACLEQMALDEQPWTPEEIHARQPGFSRWLGARGLSFQDASEGAVEAAQMLSTTVGSKEGQWVLAAHTDSAAELVMAKVSAGGTALIRVVDRCFIDQGMRWIVDYKSAKPTQSASAEDLHLHAQRYREQLMAYADLFADEGLPIRCAIFYTAYGKLVALD